MEKTFEEFLKNTIKIDKYQKAIYEICKYIDSNIYIPVKKMLHDNNISMNFGYMKEKLKIIVEKEINGLKEK